MSILGKARKPLGKCQPSGIYTLVCVGFVAVVTKYHYIVANPCFTFLTAGLQLASHQDWAPVVFTDHTDLWNILIIPTSSSHSGFFPKSIEHAQCEWCPGLKLDQLVKTYLHIVTSKPNCLGFGGGGWRNIHVHNYTCIIHNIYLSTNVTKMS